MTSNAPWNNQFEGNYSTSDSTNAWNRPLVNTPQTNPASWPQLGATSAESDRPQSTANTAQAQESSSWPAPSTMSSTGNSNDNDRNGTSAWGRLPENSAKGANATTTGWGAPSSGPAWGQPVVDDGTAVWGKSTVAQQPQNNWGSGQTQPSDTVPSSTGWGDTTSSNNSKHDDNTQPSDSSQQPAPNPTQAGSIQPISWAKAASAGLPPTSSASESVPPESEQDAAVNTTASTPQAPPSIETDPVRKIVNSHDGWGKKPIQQGTSWNIADSSSGLGRPPNAVSNGTEAWGKPNSGNIPPATGWRDTSANKPNSGWGANYNQPVSSGQAWVPPTQPQPPRLFIPPNSAGTQGWGDPQQPPSVNSGRWGDMSGQLPSNPPGWGTQVLPQKQPTVTSGWGNMPATNDSGPTGWGNAVPGRPTPQNAGWGVGMMPQSPVMEQQPWGSAPNPNRPVDDGTSAWGDPGTYSKVNMWGKQGKIGPDNPSGPMPNSHIEAKGWGVTPNQPHNRPPSPKGWGDISPTRTNPAVDNGTSAWGPKGISNEKWDKGNAVGNWNPVKPSGGGWGQSNDPHWRPTESVSNWTQNDSLTNSAMDYGQRRGILPPQPNMNPQMMFHNQMPPVLPPQLQNQFQQVRHAVNTGVIPPQVLNQQFMTPHHMQSILQLINKAAEFQNLQLKLAMLNQNKALPNVARSQESEQCRRALLMCQQQMEAHKQIIIQNTQKNPRNLNNKMNGPMGAGLDLAGLKGGPGGQPMLSPLNNMNPLAQALPSPTPPGSIASPTAREQKSRLMNSWKRPNFGGMGDTMQQPSPTPLGFNIGPGGDAMHNGMSYRLPTNQMTNFGDGKVTDGAGVLASGAANEVNQTSTTAEQNSILADFGPPEFTPGKPWRGFRPIDPESDPNITPGSVAIAKTMSINTVRDADQVLNRDRSTASDIASGASRTDESIATFTQSHTNAADINITQPWSSADANWAAQSQDSRGSWLVLTNSQQVDPVYMQNLCSQHGTVLSFQPHYPVEQTALVKYSNPDEAAHARKVLNMYMIGNTMLVATIATDHEVNNFRFMSGSAGGGFISQPPPTRPNVAAPPDMTGMPHSGTGQHYWSTAGQMSSGASWGNTAAPNVAWSGATGEEMSRIMSPMHSLLPENLLGGESM